MGTAGSSSTLEATGTDSRATSGSDMERLLISSQLSQEVPRSVDLSTCLRSLDSQAASVLNLFQDAELDQERKLSTTCGKPDQGARVVRCVRGAVLSKKGLNYKTGQRHSLVQICAKEGGKCKCTGTMIYGHGKTWAQVLKKKNVIKKVKGVTSCTNKALGKDPLPGVGKVCMCKK